MNMEHNLFECKAKHIFHKCPFGRGRWKDLVAHPFTLPRGGENITAIMRYFGSLLEVWAQHSKSPLGNILVGGKGNTFAQKSSVQGQPTESARITLARDYRNQRRHVERLLKRRQKPPSAVPAPPPKHFRVPTVRQKRRNPEPENRHKGSAAAAYALQGFPDQSQAPPLASNVATSTVARADSAWRIEGFKRTPAKARHLASPPPLRQGQRERAAHSVLVPSPIVPIHGQKRRNSEQAKENGDEEPGRFSVKRRSLGPPPPVPWYRRCPAKRSSSLFTKELYSKKHATLAVPPPTTSR
jgi:hypothetical protein